MKIAKVVKIYSVCVDGGGASGKWEEKEVHFEPEDVIQGVVEFSETVNFYNDLGSNFSSSSTLSLVIKNKKYKVCGLGGLPRVDVGEEVIVHTSGHEIKALQIVRNGKVVSRFIFNPEIETYEFKD